MKTNNPTIRTIYEGDIEAIVEIDARVYGENRSDYYQSKMIRAIDPTH